MTLIKKTIVLSLLIIHFTGMSLCKGETIDAAESTSSITIADGTALYSAPVYIADRMGLWKESGIDITIKYLKGAKPCVTSLKSGTAQFATLSGSRIVQENFDPLKFCILATLMRSSRDIQIFARKDRGISSPKDLRGRKIAIYGNPFSRVFLKAFLGRHGLQMQDVTVTCMQLPAMLPSLIEGKVDAYLIWGPHSFAVDEALGNKAIRFVDDKLYTLTFNLIANREFVKRHNKETQGLIRGLAKAVEFMKMHPKKTIRKIAKKLYMPEQIIWSVWEDYTFGVSLDKELVISLNQESGWLAELERTSTNKPSRDFTDMIMPGPLRAVRPE